MRLLRLLRKSIILSWKSAIKATNDANLLIFKGEIQYIKKAAGKSDYEGIETILKALDTAKSRLNANVNFDLTMELLLMTIQEN